MASKRIAGITIEIGGDTTKLQSALKGVDSQLRTTQSALKDVNKLLKMDPGNVELLTQKQKNLEKAIGSTKDRIQQLKDAQSGVERGTSQWDALQREIIATEQDLKGLEDEYKNFGSVAAQQVKLAGEKMQEVGGKIEGAGKAFAPVSAAAAAAGGALIGTGYKAVTAADDLNTLAKQTGLTTEDLQKMQYASDLIDVSFESITGATKKLKKSMTGHDETWKKLGISVKDADGNMKDVRTVFFETVNALSKVKNETEKDQLAMDLFGKSADELAGVIDDGGAALNEYGDKARDLGLILDQETLDSLNKTNDALDTMKAQLGGSVVRLGATMAQVLAPAVEKIAGAVEQLTVWLGKLSPEQSEVILKVVGLVAVISPLLIGVGKLITGVGMLMTYAPAVTAALGALNLSILPIVAAVAAVISIGILLIANWDKIKKAAEDLSKKLSAGWKKLKDTVVKNATAIKTGVSNAWNNMKTTVTTVTDSMKNVIQTKLNNIKKAYQDNGGGIKGIVAGTVTAVKEYWSLGFDAIDTLTGGKLSEIKDKFSETLSDMKEKASEKIESIKEKFSGGFSSIKSSIKDKFGDAYDWTKDKMNAMVDKAHSIVDKLKSAFKFKWKLPKIKLPHISVDGGEPPYGLGGKGSLPKFSIDWYRRAYNNPILFSNPTIVNTPTGMKGFGDGNGGELVYGHAQLMQDIARASSGEVTINVYATPGMDINQLADKVQARFVQLQKQKEAAYA